MTTDKTLIMIVDDDFLQRELLESVFMMNGYDVLLAHNGKRALQLATEHQPDLVLLDVRMPDMDGYSVSRALREQPNTAETLIVMMSGLEGTDQERQSASAAGANDFIERKMQTEDLTNYIAAILQGRTT